MLQRMLTIFIISFSVNCPAYDDMTNFLKSCAYGTIGGALVGLATIAASENPNGKINNVSRGASLGLYFGIAYGLYKIENPDAVKNELDASVWVTPQIAESKVEGATLNWLALSF